MAHEQPVDSLKIKVWDIPTRLFHWFLVTVFAWAFLSSHGDRFLNLHTSLGYIALGLVVFRVLWGFAGNGFARFSGFLRGWQKVKGYIVSAVRLHPPRYLGHNPAVGWVVLVMLAMVAAIAVSGIVTYGGEENRGFWAGVFSFDAGYNARAIHAFLADLAIAVVVVHICAALFHDFLLRENIIVSMFIGTKEDEETYSERVSHIPPHERRSVPRLMVWMIVALMGGLALFFLRPAGRTDFLHAPQPNVVDDKGFAAEMKVNAAWQEECAGCHNAFHPTILPAESWKKVMSGLDDHFGEVVTLDATAKDEIERFLVSASAERSATEASRKLIRSLRGLPAPGKITGIPYWKAKHADIDEQVFKRKSVVSRSNCIACHPGAELGSFEDHDIAIPE
ncbi:MAG: cytochrome b/b6 domain-containing protein [Deltaproteobacteria bacterium]|nr:cytochrome b/b6 domain-containing protein [Deltaproteobacteria bacterium]